jgi:antitoxin component YwqK of YwqJK toxin-antitoxin module
MKPDKKQIIMNKNLILTFAVCFLGWGAFAMPGGATSLKSVTDLGKGLQKVTWYYENGTVAEEGFYLNGKKHGTWTSFDEKGNKEVTANWALDKKDGNFYIMHDNGKVKYHIVYSDNKKVMTYEWDESGMLLTGNQSK